MMLQKNADPSKRDTVVLLLQDMLEVVTRDMMQNENRLVGYIYIIREFKSFFECLCEYAHVYSIHTNKIKNG